MVAKQLKFKRTWKMITDVDEKFTTPRELDDIYYENPNRKIRKSIVPGTRCFEATNFPNAVVGSA